MTKKEKSMEEQLNEDLQAERAEAEALASAEEEKKAAKKNQKRWYIVHTVTGHENKVKVNLEKRIEYMNMGEKIFRVEVPQKTVTQMKGGKNRNVKKNIPGLCFSRNDYGRRQLVRRKTHSRRYKICRLC